ncbi:MAG TPA: type II toxin-antitoxin system VapC family toxin [Caldithrix sp.]|nr:type II toxin-antitoxin system VapC family toxin [Caldithrix sp.]
MLSVDEEDLFLSVLTIGELQKGISKLSASRKKKQLSEWLENDLRLRFEYRLLPISQDIAVRWGILQGDLEKEGMPMATIDGLIAATALEYNLTLVTRNVDDFKNSGVPLFNPWSE